MGFSFLLSHIKAKLAQLRSPLTCCSPCPMVLQVGSQVEIGMHEGPGGAAGQERTCCDVAPQASAAP